MVFTRYRGRLYIHAAQRIDTRAPRFAWPGEDAGMPQGAIIGYVSLDGCSQGFHASRWADEGGWQWWVSHPVLLAEPVPCRGRQNLWPIPPEILAELREE